jgi:hypothetical protein
MQGARRNWHGMGIPDDLTPARRLDTPDFPCIFPCSRELLAEKGWLQTGSTAKSTRHSLLISFTFHLGS